jgi:ParB-like chromosome segregation protein Spo0J
MAVEIEQAMEFHEVSTIFPMMGEEDFTRLVSDIKANGLREPIWTYQGKIIDGRNRARACYAAGITPTYREWNGQGSLVAFVVSLNLSRRHLSSSQKAMVALEVEKQLGIEAEKRTGGRPLKPADDYTNSEKPGELIPQVSHRSAHQAASITGTNDAYVKQAKRIVAQAPELQEVVSSGVLNIPDAKKVAKLPQPQRAEVVDRVATKQAKNASAAILDIKKAGVEAQAQAEPTKPHITLATWEDWLPRQPQCDLLITDPPYSTDVEDVVSFADAWLPSALSKVKSTGRAYVCIGAYPHELQAYLNVAVPSHLLLVNVLVWTYKNTLGPQPHNAYKMNWQAILYYIGLNAPHIDIPIMNEQFSVQEINAPDGRMGDRYHAWQKPDELAERLIRHSTNPGDTVLDCFAGTGTFMLAAHKLGRVAAGCDRSPEMLEIARTRGCEAVK